MHNLKVTNSCNRFFQFHLKQNRRILFPNLTEEERKEKKREDNKRYLQNRTEEQKEKLKEYDKRRYQNRTEEQKNKTITPH